MSRHEALIKTFRAGILLLEDPALVLEELRSLHTLITNVFNKSFEIEHQYAYENFVGPRPFCVSPNGRYDGHGRYVKFHSPGVMVCAFCKRLPEATPANPVYPE